MALQMTLEAKYNHMAIDFVDAYWKVTELSYDTGYVYFHLKTFPDRESSLRMNQMIADKLPIGGSVQPVYDPKVYEWVGVTNIADIFPNGIPLDSNAQKTAVYNWIKSYTGLPFEDVLEEA